MPPAARMQLSLAALILCTQRSVALAPATATLGKRVRPPTSARANLIDVPDNDELLAYWARHEAKWERPLRLLDVRAAWCAGELDGILPSGRPSRAATSERMISLGRALDLVAANELQCRRRFRSSSPDELRPRWGRVTARRDKLRAEGKWETVVAESERYRAYQKSLTDGDVEGADASPAFSRAVATALSPALKQIARQRNSAEGGYTAALAELLESAGTEPDERWLTAALLADVEEEIGVLAARADAKARLPTEAKSVDESEAGRDVGDAGFGGLFGVAAALLAVALQQTLGGGGSDVPPPAGSLERAMDLFN